MNHPTPGDPLSNHPRLVNNNPLVDELASGADPKTVIPDVDMIPFTYGEFYDVPRMIRFQFEGEWYFLRSEFDEEKDEYNDFYDIYRLPHRTEEEIMADPTYWRNGGKNAHLGAFP